MSLRDPQNNMCSKGASRVYVLQHSSDKLFGSQLQLLYWIPRCNPAIGTGTWSRRAVTYAHRPRFRQVRYHVQKRTTKRTYSWRYWTQTRDLSATTLFFTCLLTLHVLLQIYIRHFDSSHYNNVSTVYADLLGRTQIRDKYTLMGVNNLQGIK